MKIAKYALPVIAVGFMAGSASAATAGWSVRGDNVVAGHVANALIVDGEGVDWTGGVLRIDLTAGSAYQDAFGGDLPPSAAFLPTFPSLEFDTYVGIINSDSAISGAIAGGAGDLGGGALSLNAPQISVSWFNTSTNDTGPTQVAMITLSDDAQGTWSLITSYAGGELIQSGGLIINGATPEPATLALMGLGGIAALRRR